MSDTLIRAEGVSKKFCRSLKKSLWYGLQDLGQELRGHRHGGQGELRSDEFWAVHDINFELKRGECLGLIGRNGAGKTTLLRMLNGLIKPDQGRIEIRGRIAALIALGAGFNPILTGRENIYVNASVLGLSKQEIARLIDDIIEFSEIDEFIDSPVQNYSSGMQVRLGFAVATALRPDVLLLDEILAVGDSAFRAKCFNRIQDTIQDCAVIFVSHSMPQVTRISDQLLLMNKGRRLASGPDLGEIIARYNSLTAEEAYTARSEGSHKATIESVSLCDSLSNEVAELSHGDPFAILLNTHLPKAIQHADPRILITIADQDDSPVAQISDRIDVQDGIERYALYLHFESTPFNAGRYSITANLLLGPRGELAHRLPRCVGFTVRHTFVGYAPILLRPSHYSVRPLA
ncbi:ABC transporter ATP-binding protein [Candidatus Thiodictyon syntrophicum]|jgi:lipopolysaccharide transport system ATP-binding protein|nr:ABC transporter ATP-binding protein [Candidatus Thiodictyon syntrophicum]